jgi:hypothetical protein
VKRKLASIQKVLEVSPIEGADRIVQIKVLGWNLVALKDEFQPGDLCVYFEIDSILPDVPCFEHIKRGSSKASALRLRTIKLRGVISQGLALPIKALDSFEEAQILWQDPMFTGWSEGQDVTDIIGVKKWEPREPGAKQDLVLKEMRGIECFVTVKMDGCSATYVHKDGDYQVCSRNLSLKSMAEKEAMLEQRKAEGKEVWPARLDRWWEMSDRLGLKEKLEARGNFAIQGEICGPGVNGNRLSLTELGFWAFQVFDIDAQKYLDYEDFVDFIKDVDLQIVPLDFLFSLNHSVEDLLDMAKGKYNNGFHREGIVVRPLKEMGSKVLKGRASFKVINNDYLLKTKQ